MALGAAVSTGLSACATTQQEALRLQLNAARIRASQVSTVVPARATSSTVRVTRLRIVSRIFVVTVRNTGRAPTSDLPISIGYLSRRRRVVLNRLPAEYFGNHLPVIPAGRSLTWIASAPVRLPRASRPFAAVGMRPLEEADPGVSLPRITVEHVRLARGRSAVTLSLVNATSIPQYQMPIFVLGEAHGEATAAGSVVVEHLGSQGTETLRVPLSGRLRTSSVTVEAPPTIFH